LQPKITLGNRSQAALRAGIELAVSPHWFRHAHMLPIPSTAGRIHLVQATLGHASITSTGRYLHARSNDRSTDFSLCDARVAILARARD
jgi:site-specific recombinase XerD